MRYKGKVTGTLYSTEQSPVNFTDIPVDFDMLEDAVDIKIKLLTSTAQIPTKANPGDACFDIYADVLQGQESDGENDKQTIPAHETVMVHTGFATEIPEWWFCPVYARSGLASKQGLRPANCTGIIDSGYRGEWLVALHNDTNEAKTIQHGDRVAQFGVQRVYYTQLTQVGELSDSQRGEGGFGSSGN